MATPQVLHDPAEIFVPTLDILSSEVDEGYVKVDCNQSSSRTAFCGGTLSFHATSAEITDQASRHYTIEELSTLSEAYWNDWSERSAKT